MNNYGASGNNVTKLVHMVYRGAGMKTWVEFFWGPAPLKFPVAPIGAILDYFRLRSQISPERIGISTSGQRRFQLLSLPRMTKKPHELWSTNRRVYFSNFDPPKVNFVGYHMP